MSIGRVPLAQINAAGGGDDKHFLEGLTVCVNYSDFLDVTLQGNLHHFDNFIVVTSYDDKRTQEICNKHSVNCIQTDVFQEREGDIFNKGLAINLGLAHLQHKGWILHLDSDIVLPDRFRNILSMSRLDEKCLYGADRMMIESAEEWKKVKKSRCYARQYRHHYLIEPTPTKLGARLFHNEWGYCPIGFFQLWNASQKKRYPYNQGSAEHTDVLFAAQFPAKDRHLLPGVITYHLESEPRQKGVNWKGRKTIPFIS